jgi:uncharacterized DUF497 family protein
MKFKWDADKNKGNIQKHGIDFAGVPSVFKLPMLTGFDHLKEYGEDRWIGLGLLKNIIVVVAFIERKDGITRLISARKATKHEREEYKKAIGY